MVGTTEKYRASLLLQPHELTGQAENSTGGEERLHGERSGDWSVKSCLTWLMLKSYSPFYNNTGSTKASPRPKSFEAVTQKIPILELPREQQTEAVNTAAYIWPDNTPSTPPHSSPLHALRSGSTLFMLEQGIATL